MMLVIMIDEGYRPETSCIFLLLGTVIFLVLIYIYSIVPHAPEFLHSFLLLVTVVKGQDLKRHAYFYSLVLEVSCVILYLSNSTSRTSIFTQLLITSDCCIKCIGSKSSYSFLLLGTGIFLYIYISDSTSRTSIFTPLLIIMIVIISEQSCLYLSGAPWLLSDSGSLLKKCRAVVYRGNCINQEQAK